MLCLVGKTCSGKDIIKKELLKLGMKPVVTTTTRPMRDGEIQDITYHFISKSEFKRLKEQNYFAETASYNTVHGEWYYGSSYKDLDNHENKVVILNPDGIENLRKKINMGDWYIVHVYCSDDVIMRRLKARGDNPKEAERRLEADKHDFININRYADVCICNDGCKSAKNLAQKIKVLYEKFLKEN